MLATATIPKPANTSPGLSIVSGASLPSSPGALSNSLSPPSPASTTGLTIHANATAETLSVDNELTNLGWLQKPGVLTSMCTALTGSPHKHSKTGTRSIRKPRSTKALDGAKADHIRRSSDKMVNVILNVRNRKYNGEDAHKPPLSFACMIFMSIESSPTKTLPVKDIYEWIMWKFPYYRNAAPGWKNSVRHNLSLNKCFKKVQRCSTRSRNTISKGGLWTVDPDYRRCLLAALKRSPYHPYHRYFTPPLSPSSSSSSLESLNPAERDAALTMCMMTSGGTTPNVTPDILHAIIHDHCYSKRPAISLPNGFGRHTGLTLDEVAAAAELILAQDAAKDNNDSSDEGIGEMDSDCDDEDDDGMEEEEEEEDEEDIPNLGDSGYGGGTSMEEMGADALLCLAGGRSRSISPDKGNTATNS